MGVTLADSPSMQSLSVLFRSWASMESNSCSSGFLSARITHTDSAVSCGTACKDVVQLRGQCVMCAYSMALSS